MNNASLILELLLNGYTTWLLMRDSAEVHNNFWLQFSEDRKSYNKAHMHEQIVTKPINIHKKLGVAGYCEHDWVSNKGVDYTSISAVNVSGKCIQRLTVFLYLNKFINTFRIHTNFKIFDH